MIRGSWRPPQTASGSSSAVSIVAAAPALLLVATGIGYFTASLARGGVVAVANARRSRSLGAPPTVVSRAALRVRIDPRSEGAAAFAGGTGGPLGDRLAEHVRRARGTSRSGIGTFAGA